MRCRLIHDFGFAIKNLWRLVSNGSFFALLILFFSDQLSTAIGLGLNLEPKITVVDIGFSDGEIYQEVEPENIDALEAHWSAVIYHDGKLVCNGSGRWVYTPKIQPVRMTPNQWTGDNCQMEEGKNYTARATWRWLVLTEDGGQEMRSTTERFQFIYEGVY